ncbi:MAG: tetratricopeptide repeat protein [Syntrophaceae bacterium]|nr:tetratricopeptide repeat protein [Syntrophaceae bacterium]
MNGRKKILFCMVMWIWTYGFLLIQEVHSKNSQEDEQWIRVGIGAFKDGFYDIAEKQFFNFIKIYPKHDKVYEIYYLLGRTLFMRGRLKEAKDLFLKVMNEAKTFENMEDTLLSLSEVEIKLGNREEASKLLHMLVKRFPKFDQIDYSYYLLGLTELGLNRLTAAEATFKKISQDPKQNDLLQFSKFWLGILSFKQRQYETAIHYFQPLWENPKSISPEYIKYAVFWLGEAYLRLGRYPEARLYYKTFHDRYKMDSLLPEVIWRLGFCEYQSGNVQNALETFHLFKNQFKESPLLFYTHYLLGKILMMRGDHLSSIKELNSILNSSQENTWGGAALLTLYWNYLQLGEDDGVNRTFQRLQRSNQFEEEKVFLQWLSAEMYFSGGEISESLPYYFNILNTKFRERALLQIGKGNFFENKFREAITNLDILLLEYPTSPYLEESLFLKGECLFQLGNVAPALEAYEFILRHHGNPRWQLFALMQLASLHIIQKDYEKAENAFRKVLDDFPNHPLFYQAALQLGNLSFIQKNIVGAVPYYSIVLKGNVLELFGEAYFALGEAFFQQGRYDKALSSFETAMQYVKETSSWFFLTQLEIGNLKRRGGKYEEAKKSYLTIINQTKDEEIKNAASELLNRMSSR